MKRTLRKKGIVDVLMSTDGVRFARCVSEGSSDFASDGAQRGAKAGAFAYTAMQGFTGPALPLEPGMA